ncbi:hypothetical protein DRO35_04810 [Candidatus Bathyarchaeota archaeon]|nr:MAG: hypothetical protein DRO35_04810 [Candidatus Bathyarchaeota archaeon]
MRRKRIDRTFLAVAEAKSEETKKFLEDLAKESKRRLVIKDNGVVFVYNHNNEIVRITTIGEICKEMASEI